MKKSSPPDETFPAVFEESHEVPLVELSIAARSGAMSDEPGKEGALAIALRCLRRGAGTRTAFAIDEEIDRLGAEFGGSAGVSSATIHSVVLRRNLDRFLELWRDLLLRPTFPEKEVAQVLRETKADILESFNDDRALAGWFFRRNLFAGHPFGRPTYGTLQSLEKLTTADVRAAFERTFSRDNLVLGVSGALSPQEFQQLAEQTRASLPVRAVPSRELPEPKLRKGRRLVLVNKPERTQCQIYIGCAGTLPKDRDHTALILGDTIFGGTFTSRLMQEVRVERGWSYGASSRLSRDRVREAWSMWTFPAAKDAADCIALQLELLEKLVKKGVTKRELKFAKSYLTKSHAFDIDTPNKRLWMRVEPYLLDLPRGYHERWLDRIEATTLDDVNEALAKRLQPENLLFVVVGTAAVKFAEGLEKAVPHLDEIKVVPFDSQELPTT